MAVTLSQQPSNIINPAYSDIVYVLQGGATTQFYHKYVLQVFVGNGLTGINLVATLKASANESGKGIFNIANILQDFCTTDKEGFVDPSNLATATFNGVAASSVRHSVHQTDAYSANTANVQQFYVKFTEEYATTADGIVTQQALSAPSTKKLVFNATHEHANGLDTFNGFDYCLSSTNSKLLTGFDSSINRKVRRGDFHTLAFLGGTFGSVAAQQSYPTHFQVQLYTYNGVALGAAIDIDLNTNNALPLSLFNWAGGFTGTSGALWHFGCGVANLVNNGITVPDPNTVSYTIQAYNSSTPISEIYTFDIIDDDCKGFETIRLAYLNRLGTYDYYNFTKKSTRTTAVQKNTFKSSYGTWQGDNYTYGSFEGGTNNYGVTANETIEANSDFMTEAEAAALEELFTSPSVFMQNDTTSYYAYEPVVITESSYVKQTKANDKVIQYVIGLHKSHNKRIQRL